MLQDFLWADSLTRVNAKNVHEQVEELLVTHPRLARKVEALL